MLFFGVPNLGLRNDQLETFVRGQPNAALIHDLVVNSDSEPSTSLKRQAREFSENCKSYRAVTFFESKQSPLLKVNCFIRHERICTNPRPTEARWGVGQVRFQFSVGHGEVGI